MQYRTIMHIFIYSAYFFITIHIFKFSSLHLHCCEYLVKPAYTHIYHIFYALTWHEICIIIIFRREVLLYD